MTPDIIGCIPSAIPSAWKLLADIPTEPVTVAVIDTGIESDNPHLKDRIDPRGRNFVPSPPSDNVEDKQGHGTAIAASLPPFPPKRTIITESAAIWMLKFFL